MAGGKLVETGVPGSLLKKEDSLFRSLYDSAFSATGRFKLRDVKSLDNGTRMPDARNWPFWLQCRMKVLSIVSMVARTKQLHRNYFASSGTNLKDDEVSNNRVVSGSSAVR
ncbi:unnamed protein product [Soboliphyme baturini]|uniref:Uncharacterized protein n=1 Tax=Soboliphyme baturini TaxID=241478 RepID=A0A183ILR9_9BILA|nr:unnamed protein product [Soboliphyme baturini]